MQDFSSTVSFSPNFSFYVSGDGNIVETAVRVVRESQSHYSVKVDGDDESEFEFETSPLREELLPLPNGDGERKRRRSSHIGESFLRWMEH
ncbi:hypothetical protein Bca52824_092847 [Brassica carinata]|uniref:Uncharacterized protein n=1 Tax=Brassica carinata TaxID=52824 RepID=A0A8X7P756_BRACI|nr:hypothetical protein Bca52824_092847 [Brassica carinata]